VSAVDPRGPLAWLVVVLAALVWSGVDPADRATWWAEALPVMIGVPILVATFRRHPLTPLLYALIALHSVILVVGARYTYAEVPLGFWMQDWFGFERKHYDRIGHLAQGFVPAILAREVLLRATPLRRGGWLFYLVLCVCLSFSAFYELIEWVAAEAVSLIQWLCVTEVGFAYGVVLTGAMQGAGDTTRPLWLTVISLWFMRIPMAYVLALLLGMGPVGAWIAMGVSQLLNGVLCALVFRTGRWKTQKV
jgi:putative membrane protein